MAESIQTSLASINMKLEYIQKDVKELKDNMHDYSERVVQLEKDGLTHSNTCPQNKELGGVIQRVDCIEKDLEEYRMAKKYPKLVLVLILVFSLLALGTGITTMQKVTKEVEKLQKIEAISYIK